MSRVRKRKSKTAEVIEPSLAALQATAQDFNGTTAPIAVQDAPVRRDGDAAAEAEIADSSSDSGAEIDDSSSDSEADATVFLEVELNGAGNAEQIVKNTPLHEHDGKYYLQCRWGEVIPRIVPAPTKDFRQMLCTVLSSEVEGEAKDTPIHNKYGETSVKLNEKVCSEDSYEVDRVGDILTEAALSVLWKGGIVPDDDETSDDSESDDIQSLYVEFCINEASGAVRSRLRKTFPVGTSYSDIRNDDAIKAVLAETPYRKTGYWYFKGWSEDFKNDSKTLDDNVTSWAQYEPAKVQIEVNFNEATNIDDVIEATRHIQRYNDKYYLECTWGEMFPSITPPIRRNEELNWGVFLTALETNRTITRTHTSDGKGVTTVSASDMGAATIAISDDNSDSSSESSESSSESSEEVITIRSCYLVVHWSEPLKWNTQEDLRNAIGVIPSPFAADPSATVSFAYDNDDDSDSDSDPEDVVNFKTGFPDAYEIPLIDPHTGKVNEHARVITRKQVNTLGYIGTQEQFFEQCGGYHTFDTEICDAIGGYPEGAILRFYDADINCLRTVYSLLDDNTWNFLEQGVDGIHWKYIDDNPVLNLKIDYSDFIDLRDVLFVETGIPEFYTVPFDGYLQLHALSFCDMHPTLRDTHTEYALEIVNIWQSEENVDDRIVYTPHPIYEKVQGALETGFEGATYLDIYNDKTNTTNSIKIRGDGSIIFRASAWQATQYGPNGAYYMYKMPRYVVTQGSVFLNKGDQIRIRGSYIDRKILPLLGEASRVYDRTMSDKEVIRNYLCKFANLYRVGWEG